MIKLLTLVVLYFVLHFFILISVSAEQLPIKEDSKWLELLDSASQEVISISPDGKFTMVLHQAVYPTLDASSSQTSESLVGLNFYTDVASQVSMMRYHHITIIGDNELRDIITPENGQIVDYNWAPNSSRLALLIENSNRIRLWIYEIKSKKLRLLTSENLSVRLGGRHLRWLPDSSAVVVKKAAPPNQEATTLLRATPLLPRVQSTDERIKQGRTYQNLLNSKSKQLDFIKLTTSQLIKVDLQGVVVTVSDAMMIDHYAISPDGQYILVESLPTVLSRHIPYKKWGRKYCIINLSNFKLVHRLPNLLDKINLAKAKDSVPSGSRGVQWLSFDKSTISWVEAIDGGVMTTELAAHDRIFKLASPFKLKKQTLLDVHWRYHAVFWSKTGTAILQEWRYRDKQSRTSLISIENPRNTKLLSQRDYRDKYSDIGDPLTQRTPEGNVELLEGKKGQVYLSSMGYSDTGSRPFLDVYTVDLLDKKRLFLSSENTMEVPVFINNKYIVIRRESSNKPPEYIRLTGDKHKNKSVIYSKPVVKTIDYTSQEIEYERRDGLKLRGILHMPNSLIVEKNSRRFICLSQGV